MSAATKHPDPRELTDYVLGRLEDETLESISAHVETCTECQETLTHLDASDDTLVRGIAAGGADDPFADESECQAALSAVRRIDVAPQGEETCAPESASGQPLDAEDAPETLRDYQLLAKLGEGGMGAVYQARHLRLDRLVALKVLPASRMQQPEALARFHREMKAVGNLNHPNIVQAHDAGEVDDKHFLVMELVDGVDLAALVDREGPLNVADACELIRQAAVGLDHAHRHGLVHRDVKPSNLMLNHAGVVKVLDLGLARVLGEEQAEGSATTAANKRPPSVFQSISGELTGADQIMGTPDYMAPEQLNDSRAVDARSDVYSLGATLYKLLSGAAPFTGEQYDTLAKKMVGLAEHPVPPLAARRDDLSPALIQIVERMLAKEPADRYASPAQVAAALAPFCQGQEVQRLAESMPSVERMSAPTALQMELATQPLKSIESLRDASGGRGSVRNWLVGAVTAGLVALAAMVIYVQTNSGTLEIRSEAPDQIQIEILDDAVVVKSAAVGETPTNLTLPVGEYQVRIAGEHGDQIAVGKDQVAITRGDTTPVTLAWNPHSEDDSTTTLTRRSAYLDPKTRHAYQLFDQPMSWHEAKAFCESRGGHLVTINSAEENSLVHERFADQHVVWLGASDEQVEGQWRWITGEPFEYRNWQPGEPNGRDSGEDYLVMGSDASPDVQYHFGPYWNDDVATRATGGRQFIVPLCEWEPGQVPEQLAGSKDGGSEDGNEVRSREDHRESELPASVASEEVRASYARLRKAYQQMSSPDQLMQMLEARAPALADMMQETGQDDAEEGVDALLQFVTSLPESTQTALLKTGHVKWRWTRLDRRRQAMINRFVRELLGLAGYEEPTAEAPPDGGPLVSILLAADVGLAVLRNEPTDGQVLVAFLASPDVLTPVVVPLVGKLGDWQSTAVQADWRRQIEGLRDQAYTKLPSPAPAADGRLRRSFAKLRDHYRRGMSAEELDGLLKSQSPLLAHLPVGPLGKDSLLQFIDSLPDETQKKLLDDGYLRYRYAELDWQRQAMQRNFLVQMLKAAPMGDAVEEGSFDEKLAVMLLAADVGLAVLADPESERQVVAAYMTYPNSPFPTVVPVVGDIGPWIDREVRESWARQAMSLRDRPYSPPLKPLPARFGTKFHPATHTPITRDGVSQEFVDGAVAWRIETDEPRTVRLFEVEPPEIEDCVLTYSAEMKTDHLQGRAYLEMWCDVPGHGESFSKGFHHGVSGTNDWASYQTPFLLREGERPDVVKLNLVIEGSGTVWLRQIELTAAPARPEED